MYLSSPCYDASLTTKNVILNAWCLVSAVAGTYFADSIGRKRLAIGSSLGLTIFIFIVGALTAGMILNAPIFVSKC